MAEKSINSLPGMLATKKLPASGRLEESSRSIEGNHDKDSFHTKLMTSMKKTQKAEKQEPTDNPSESNSFENTQTYEEKTTTDIPSESNAMKNAQRPDEQTANETKSEIAKTMDTTDDVNHKIKLLSLGIQPDQAANTNSNQGQQSAEINQNLLKDGIANATNNNNPNSKTPTTQLETNVLVEKALLNNQELKLPNGSNVNISQKLAGDLIPVPAASPSGKLTTTELASNTTQQAPGDIEQELPQTSLSDKLSTNNTKMGEQRILDILNSTGMSETATKSNEDESMLPISKLSANQAKELTGNDLNKNNNKAQIKSNQNTVSTIEKPSLDPIADAQKAINSKIANINSLPHTDESASNKPNEMPQGQHQNKSLYTNADKNVNSQQALTQAQIESEETPKILEASANISESKATKLIDNTTLTASDNINAVESTMQSNTSSDSSAFSNQRADVDSNLSSNAVNNSVKTSTETNFNKTLSQVNSSAKPLVSIGNDVADNIVQSAKLYTQGGKSEIKVQLSPPELGTIKLEFKVEDDVLETKIIVERSSVKDVIEKDIPRLRELIANADIDVGKLDVSLQDNENSKMDFMNKDFSSDSKSKGTQEPSQQEGEYHDDNIDEETVSNNSESTQINYLV
jgi:flagellar hook-length control protein FliK